MSHSLSAHRASQQKEMLEQILRNESDDVDEASNWEKSSGVKTSLTDTSNFNNKEYRQLIDTVKTG